MSEVVDDNYGQAHAVCKSVIEEGGRVAVAVAVVVVVGGQASEHEQSATVRQGAITSPRQWPLFARSSPGFPTPSHQI